MRQLKCLQIPGRSVQEILDEFNERASEFGVTETDIISISAMPPTSEVTIKTPKGTAQATVEVVIVYWANT